MQPTTYLGALFKRDIVKFALFIKFSLLFKDMMDEEGSLSLKLLDIIETMACFTSIVTALFINIFIYFLFSFVKNVVSTIEIVFIFPTY